MNFSFGLRIGCQQVLKHPNLHSKKYRLILKRDVKKQMVYSWVANLHLLWFTNLYRVCGGRIIRPDICTQLFGTNMSFLYHFWGNKVWIFCIFEKKNNGLALFTLCLQCRGFNYVNNLIIIYYYFNLFEEI